jgi:hypothetical protein
MLHSCVAPFSYCKSLIKPAIDHSCTFNVHLASIGNQKKCLMAGKTSTVACLQYMHCVDGGLLKINGSASICKAFDFTDAFKECWFCEDVQINSFAFDFLSKKMLPKKMSPNLA